MLRWKQLGENTVCSTGGNSGDLYSGTVNSMRNPDDCPKLCLTKPNCAFATYWGSSYKQCYLYSAGKCTNPKADTKYKGITWKRHIGSYCRCQTLSPHIKLSRLASDCNYHVVTSHSLTHSLTNSLAYSTLLPSFPPSQAA